MIFRRKKSNEKRQKRIDSTVYAWRGRPQTNGPIVYVYLRRCGNDSGSIATAVRISGQTRQTVLSQLVRQNPPRDLVAFYQECRNIWDELLPAAFRVESEYPTHLLEVGLQGRGLPRSPFFETALCLNAIGRDRGYSDFAAIAIGGFLQWQFGTWTKADFDGAALNEKPAITWVLQCIFSKWKSLR
jgi:hypothetical protein